MRLLLSRQCRLGAHGSAVLGILCAAVILLAMLHVLPWSVAIGSVLFLGIVGYVVLPYVTPFSLVEDHREHEHRSG